MKRKINNHSELIFQVYELHFYPFIDPVVAAVQSALHSVKNG
jgi:hypothetical protein